MIKHLGMQLHFNVIKWLFIYPDSCSTYRFVYMYHFARHSSTKLASV